MTGQLGPKWNVIHCSASLSVSILHRRIQDPNECAPYKLKLVVVLVPDQMEHLQKDYARCVQKIDIKQLSRILNLLNKNLKEKRMKKHENNSFYFILNLDTLFGYIAIL